MRACTQLKGKNDAKKYRKSNSAVILFTRCVWNSVNEKICESYFFRRQSRYRALRSTKQHFSSRTVQCQQPSMFLASLFIFQYSHPSFQRLLDQLIRYDPDSKQSLYLFCNTVVLTKIQVRVKPERRSSTTAKTKNQRNTASLSKFYINSSTLSFVENIPTNHHQL